MCVLFTAGSNQKLDDQYRSFERSIEHSLEQSEAASVSGYHSYSRSRRGEVCLQSVGCLRCNVYVLAELERERAIL